MSCVNFSSELSLAVLIPDDILTSVCLTLDTIFYRGVHIFSAPISSNLNVDLYLEQNVSSSCHNIVFYFLENSRLFPGLKCVIKSIQAQSAG